MAPTMASSIVAPMIVPVTMVAHDKANQRSEHNRALEVARARQPLGIAQKGDQENQDCLDNHDSP